MTTPEPGRTGAPPEFPLFGWAKAIVLGIRDTAREMLEEGQRGAREAHDEAWHRFDEKTKRRRSGDR